MRWIVSILILGLLQGCIVTSTYPISTKSVEDRELLAKWQLRDSKERITLTFRKQNDHITLYYEEFQGDDRSETMLLRGYIATFQNKKYLNLKVIQSDKKFPDGYLIMPYSIEKHHLRLNVIDSNLIEQAIQAKKLQGNISKGFLAPILISDSQNNLQAFITQNKKLFVDINATFQKVE